MKKNNEGGKVEGRKLQFPEFMKKGNKKGSKLEKEKIKKEFMEEKEKVGQIAKEVKEEVTFRRRLFNSIRGIRMKILIAIFIPVLLMAIFGIVCYVKTSDAITKNYEKSTSETIDAVRDYLTLGLDSVENKAVEFMFNNTVTNYYSRISDKETLDDLQNYNDIKEEAVVVQSMNPFIGALHIIGKNGRGLTTGTSKITVNTDAYSQFADSDDGKSIKAAKGNYTWVGKHSGLDKMLGLKEDSYAASYMRQMSYGTGYLIFDVSTDTIMAKLAEIKYGKGSILGFVTEDGKETLANTDEKAVFSNLDYYKKAVSDKKISGYSYQEYKGDQYLFSFSKIGNTGCMVCALIPKAMILKQADSIKQLIFVFVILASVIAIIVGSFIAGGIASAIYKLMKSISRAAKGDLTVEFESKRKDEFLILSKSLNEMMAGMRSLIGEVALVGNRVNESAAQLSTTSENILGSTKDISLTIDEIEKGVVQQATDTENCSGQMSNLSDKINQVYGSTYEIEKIAGDTKNIVRNGILIVDELKNKTKATSDVTQVVINEIKALEEQSHSIGNFVGIINEIASQTNLLSLNASIEAARAGQAGRGFAVVADEIRKLADESVKAAKEIEGIVHQIQSKTQNTAVTAKKAEDIVESQTEALHKTVDVFENIDKHVVQLAGNLDTISIGVKGIENAKEDTVDAISNISAVSQETAAAAEEVSATASSQIQSVEDLSQSARDLASDAQKLQEVIQAFSI